MAPQKGFDPYVVQLISQLDMDRLRALVNGGDIGQMSEVEEMVDQASLRQQMEAIYLFGNLCVALHNQKFEFQETPGEDFRWISNGIIDNFALGTSATDVTSKFLARQLASEFKLQCKTEVFPVTADDVAAIFAGRVLPLRWGTSYAETRFLEESRALCEKLQENSLELEQKNHWAYAWAISRLQGINDAVQETLARLASELRNASAPESPGFLARTPLATAISFLGPVAEQSMPVLEAFLEYGESLTSEKKDPELRDLYSAAVDTVGRAIARVKES